MLFTVLSWILYPFRFLTQWSRLVEPIHGETIAMVIQRLYLPTLDWSLYNWPMLSAWPFALLIATVGMFQSGVTPWILMPKLDSYLIEAKVVYPDGTPSNVTDKACKRLADAIRDINKRYTEKGTPLVKYVYRTVGNVAAPGAMGPDARATGSHVGLVEVEMFDSSERPVHSEQVLTEWRRQAGVFPGAESLKFGIPQFGPGGYSD